MIKKYVLLTLTLFSVALLPFVLYATTVGCGDLCGIQVTGMTVDMPSPASDYLLAVAWISVMGLALLVLTARFTKVYSRRTVPTVTISKDSHLELAHQAIVGLKSHDHLHYSNKNLDAIRKEMTRYFKRVYGLPESFTLNDLSSSMKGSDGLLVQIILSYLTKLSSVSYTGRSMIQPEYEALVNEAIEIIRITSPLPKSSRLNQKKVTVRISHNDSAEMFSLINRSYKSLAQSDLSSAAELYYQASKVYETLAQFEKQRTYETVKRLHDEIVMRTRF